MKKLTFLALVLFAVFAIASCSGDETELDYSTSTVSFTLDGTLYTWGGTSACYATLTASELTLKAANPENSGDTFKLTFDLTGKTAPYAGNYGDCTLGLKLGNNVWQIATNSITVSLQDVPETAGELVKGSIGNGTVISGVQTKYLNSGSFALVLK